MSLTLTGNDSFYLALSCIVLPIVVCSLVCIQYICQNLVNLNFHYTIKVDGCDLVLSLPNTYITVTQVYGVTRESTYTDVLNSYQNNLQIRLHKQTGASCVQEHTPRHTCSTTIIIIIIIDRTSSLHSNLMMLHLYC